MSARNTRWTLLLSTAFLLLASLPLAAEEPAAAPAAEAATMEADISLEELIAKTLKARGGLEAMKAIESARMSGKMVGPGQEFPITVEVKRPDKIRIEVTIQGMSMVQAYDGETGWMVAPMMGATDPQKMPAEQLEQFKQMADFDGALVDYEKKGYQLELLGKEEVEGTEAYKLKVTYDTGLETTTYIDSEYFMEFHQKSTREMGGQTVEGLATMGDFKEVDGVIFAHSIEQSAAGAPFSNTLTFETIETNVEIDDERFSMPEPEAGESDEAAGR